MDGVIVIDKPAGWTSHDVVAKVRNITRIKKVGHTGTLDPFATGVLPLTLGKATRLTNHFLASDKLYRGVMRFGFATTTFDLEGEPLGPHTQPEIDEARLEEIFSRCIGNITQTLPPYSAKKVAGKPLYAYARRGVDMGEATKDVVIKDLRLIGVEGCDAEFELTCAAGTYARSLAHDVGKAYGCGAHLVRLRRIRTGEFSIEAATTLGEGADFHPRDYFLDRVVPLRELLREIPAITLSEGDRDRASHGMDLNLLTGDFRSKEFRLLDESGELLALAQLVQAFVSPVAQPAQWVRVHPHVIFA